MLSHITCGTDILISSPDPWRPRANSAQKQTAQRDKKCSHGDRSETKTKDAEGALARDEGRPHTETNPYLYGENSAQPGMRLY
jgi:hypothetical protein